jgi:cob(I)alamin adenosyltransferase
MGEIACQEKDFPEYQKEFPIIEESLLDVLDKKMEELDAILPKQKGWIIPGTDFVESTIHMASSLAREAELKILKLHEDGEKVRPLIWKIFNRVSDVLFQCARAEDLHYKRIKVGKESPFGSKKPVTEPKTEKQ